jgi:hypothetical protein
MSENGTDYYNLMHGLNFNDTIIYGKASLDARYPNAESRTEYGPYQGKIVDFPDSGTVTRYTRLGVRDDGFHGDSPIYYVRLGDIIKTGEVNK